MAGQVSVRRGIWRARNLFVSWCAYWLALIVVGLGPAIVAGWRMTHNASGHGTAGVSFNDGVMSAKIAEASNTTWTGSISLLSLALLIALPPLVLWVIWLVGASRTNNAGETGAIGRNVKRELNAKDSRADLESPTSKRPAREEF
jgi:hypothetical protein